MDLTFLTHPTAGGLVCAAGAIVAGAPLFSDGIRAVRLRRHLAGLAESALTPDLAGFTHVHGRVALESPMFSPLTSAPCAAFQLEVRAVGALLARTVEVRRSFRVADGDRSVRLESTGGRWALPVTGTRTIAPGDPLTEGQARLLARVPDAMLWRRAGGRLRLVERALLAGASCHVVGVARHARALEPALEQLRTGTDGVPAAAVPADPDVWIGPGEFLDFLYVSDRPPSTEALVPAPWRSIGAVAGPALSLAGLLYLAAAADWLRLAARS